MATATANIEFGYDGSDFKRTYAIEMADSIAANDSTISSAPPSKPLTPRLARALTAGFPISLSPRTSTAPTVNSMVSSMPTLLSTPTPLFIPRMEVFNHD